MVVEHLFTS